MVDKIDEVPHFLLIISEFLISVLITGAAHLDAGAPQAVDFLQ